MERKRENIEKTQAHGVCPQWHEQASNRGPYAPEASALPLSYRDAEDTSTNTESVANDLPTDPRPLGAPDSLLNLFTAFRHLWLRPDRVGLKELTIPAFIWCDGEETLSVWYAAGDEPRTSECEANIQPTELRPLGCFSLLL